MLLSSLCPAQTARLRSFLALFSISCGFPGKKTHYLEILKYMRNRLLRKKTSNHHYLEKAPIKGICKTGPLETGGSPV